MVAAHVEEGAKHPVRATNDHDGFACGKLGRDEAARSAKLIDAAGDLPGAREDGVTLEIEQARVGIPGRRDRRRFGQGLVAGVAADDVGDGRTHHVNRRHGRGP